MSKENVDIVRRAFEAYNRGELDWDVLHPEIVWNTVEETPQYGREAVKAYFERWESPSDELETIPEEYVDGGDKVLVTVLNRGRGQASGIVVELRLHQVWELRDGLEVRLDEFSDRREALEHAGLPA